MQKWRQKERRERMRGGRDRKDEKMRGEQKEERKEGGYYIIQMYKINNLRKK